MTINQMSTNETSAYINVLVTSIEEKEDRNGNPYIIAEISDGDNKVPVRMFGTSLDEAPFNVGDVLDANIISSLYNGSMTFKMSDFTVVTDEDGINIEDYVVSAPISNDEMDADINSLIGHIVDTPLRELTQSLYKEYEQQLIYYPAAKSHHHNYYGGLKYHSLCVAKNAYALAKTYEFANKDLCIAGALLHDIGKIFEYDSSMFGDAEYNVDGNLFGHLFIGAEIVKNKAKEMGVSSEIIRNLVHIILSHHDNPEWGAVKMPTTIEARIVSSADFVDSQVEAMRQATDAIEPGTTTTGYVCGVKPYKANF